MPRAASHASDKPKTKAKPKAPNKAKAKTQPVKQPKVATQTKKQAMAKARAIAPSLQANIGSTPHTKYRGNPDIFGRLVEDHDRHRALFAMLQDTEPGSPQRKRVFTELVLDIKAHAAAEEQALWSTVMRLPATTEDARHAVGEHKEMDKMLADLAARDMAGNGWLRRVAKVRDEYLHHIREEEQEQFLASEQHLTAADLKYMRGVFNRRKKAEKAAAKVVKKIRLKA